MTEKKYFTIDTFNGGQLSALADEKIPQNAAKLAQNCYIDIDGTVRKRNTQEYIEDIGDTDDRVKNYCLYKKSNGTKYDIIIAHSESTSDAAKIYYRQHGVNSSYTRLSTGVSTNFGKNCDVALHSYKDLLWISDGDTHAYYWNGTTLTDVTAGALWGAGYDDPLYIADAHGAIYLAGFASDPAAVYYSRYYNDDGGYISPSSTSAWNDDQIFKVEDTGAIITGIKGYKDMLVIFTNSAVYALTGYISQYNNSALRKIYSDDGCISNNSITEVNGALMWVGEKGVYSFDGNSISITSQGIKEYFEWMSYLGIYKYTWNIDEEADFLGCDTLINTDVTSRGGNALSAMYPQAGYVITYDRDAILEPSGGQDRSGFIKAWYSLAQKIYVEQAIETSHLYVKFSYKFEDASHTTMTLALSTVSDGLNTDTYSTTTTLTADGDEHEAIVDLGAVSLNADTYYYVKFKASISATEGLYIKYFRTDACNSNTVIYYKDDSASVWQSVDASNDSGLDVVMMPDYATIITDVKQIDSAHNIDRFNVYFDSTYNDSDSSNLYYYRYSKTSKAACEDVSNTWTALANNSSLATAISVSNESVWIQFKILAYNDEASLDYETSSFKIDAISLSYTVGSGTSLRIYGVEFDKRYFVSIPRQGVSVNDIVFVFDGKAWTIYDLPTYCMWEQDDEFTYGLSNDNRIYQINATESVTTDQWNSETDWEGYALDSNCDDDTDSGSLQADLVGDYGDLFNDASIDAKWTISDVAKVTESDGQLHIEASAGANEESAYETISLDTSSLIETKLATTDLATVGQDDVWNGGGLRIESAAGGASSARFFLVRKIDASHLFVVVSDGESEYQGYATIGISTNVYLKIAKTGSSYVFSYSTDGDTYTTLCTETLTATYETLFLVSRNASGGTTQTVHFDYLYATMNTSQAHYRIYSYNSTGAGNIYWETTNTSSTNSVKIYYASAPSPSMLDDGTLNDKYVWTLLGTATNTTPDSNTTFNPRPYRYIKVVFDNPDNSYSPLLDRLYIISDENVEMIWETGLLEYGTPDNEKYIRNVYVDAESDGGLEFYYKTEKMDNYRSVDLASGEKRTSLPPEHGKKIQFKLVSDNALPCIIKHITMAYKERKHR